MNNYITVEEIKRRLSLIEHKFDCKLKITEAKGIPGCWYISLDPIDLDWTPDQGYIADFKSQYGYEPDSSDMYYDYDAGLYYELQEIIKEQFDSKYFTLSEWEVSTEYQYVEFTLEQSFTEENKSENIKQEPLFPNINVFAICDGKTYVKTIEQRENMVGEDVRDLLKKIFKDFLHKADIFFCCTLNDSNYLGYHKANGIELTKYEVFEKFVNDSNWYKILQSIEQNLPGLTELYQDLTDDTGVDRIRLQFASKSEYAIDGSFAKSTIDEIKLILESYNIGYTMSILPKLGNFDIARMIIKPYPKIERFLKF